MRAIVREKYGTADVLELRDVDTPVMTDDDVLVRVRAASVNPYDWHVVTGVPYIARLVTGLRRPKSHLLGADFAGIVEAAGSNVRHLRPGDEVFGAGTGSFAEQLCVRADRAVAPKPEISRSRRQPPSRWPRSRRCRRCATRAGSRPGRRF